MKQQLTIITLVALTAILLIHLNHQTKSSPEFEEWKIKYTTNFDGSEEVYRKSIFQKNLKTIKGHNNDPTQTYKMAVNQFTIYSQQEFKARFLGDFVDTSTISIEIKDNKEVSNIEIDWTVKGAVSRVKNQGSCGSCWAFAAVASCESWALLDKKKVDLSEQQLVDCSGSYGNHGCNGGSRQLALRYIKGHGITSETAYPYKGITDTCKKQGGQFHITAITQASGCTGIRNALEGRPIAVAVDAGGWSHYASGVFSNCGMNINHAVLLVGVVNGAWKIKNSWGTAWGEKGFIRLGGGNTCGICNSPAVYPH